MKWVPFELFIMNKARFGMGPKWVRPEMEQSGPKWDGPDMGRAPNGQARNGRPEMVRPEMAGPEMGYTRQQQVKVMVNTFALGYLWSVNCLLLRALYAIS